MDRDEKNERFEKKPKRPATVFLMYRRTSDSPLMCAGSYSSMAKALARQRVLSATMTVAAWDYQTAKPRMDRQD